MTIDKTIEAIEALLPGQSSLEHWKSGPENPTDKEYYGEFCTPDQIGDLQALAAELKELREFVGAIETHVKRMQLKGGCEIVPRFDQWAVFDESGSIDSHYATFRKAFDAWRKMNAGEGE